jgi:SAM-dependent methyltransferase
VDVSADLIERGSALGVPALRCADIRGHIANASGSYDCIIFRDVLEHFPRPQIVELLADARAVLAPGGTIIVQVPNAEAPIAGRIRYGDFTHEMAFTEASLAQLLGATGFRAVRFAPAGPIGQLGRELPRFLLWKAIELTHRIVLYGVSGRRRAIVTESIIVVGARPEAGRGA